MLNIEDNLNFKKYFIISLIVSGIYITIGIYDYFTDLSVSEFVDSLYEDLSLTLVLPSNMFGIVVRNFGSSDVFFILGQLIGYIQYCLSICAAIIMLKLLYRKIKNVISSVTFRKEML